MLQAPRRLSAIRFEAQPPPPALVLPRMDVTGFVGYAASGPIDLPVAVEDPARFADLFGADLELAWDSARSEPVYAALAPAVRSFFRNGGRRCFVVRVAGEGARATAFQLPNLVADTSSGLGHALFFARSVGTWGDALRVAVSVSVTKLIVRVSALQPMVVETVSPRGDVVRPGDLLRLRQAGGWTLLTAVAGVGGASLQAVTERPLWCKPVRLAPRPLSRVFWIGPTGTERSAGAAVTPGGTLRVNTPLERAPAEGSLVRLRALAGDDLGGPGTETWASIGTRARSDGGVELAFQPLSLRRSQPAEVTVPLRSQMVAERLELELWVQAADARHRVGGLGFAPSHPRFVGDLPTDDELYAGDVDDGSELWAAVREPRFPLARNEPRVPPAEPKAPAAGYFPIAASLLTEPWLRGIRQAGDERARDGLEPFSPAVFIDSRLRNTRTFALLAQADHLRYGGGGGAKPLRGLHALLGVEDVTLVAVPDAAQAGWTPEIVAQPPAPAPDPPPPDLPPGAFAACAAIAVAPTLSSAGDPATDNLTLTWDPPPQGSEIEVEEAADPDFQTARVLYRGTRRELELGGRPEGVHFYRARFVAGTDYGPYATLSPVGAPARPRAVLRSPYRDGVLVSVHRALLRMCVARGDLLALLALPEHYREDDAAAHPAVLAGRRPTQSPVTVPALAEGEAGAFSCAMLHHPWLVAAGEERPEQLRRVPPDGAMAGVAAGRAIERGAWVAPANVALLDVVALSPELLPDRRDLQDAQVNVVEQTPRGFMALSADTLATDPDLRPVNVRRLLHLLRRLALRHGETYAFEPGGDVLRRTAQSGFEAVLAALFALGAFSGTHPDEGFRVVTGNPPNTPRTAEAGQLIVELRVAPSRPLAFLTVRLLRAGDGRLLVETA